MPYNGTEGSHRLDGALIINGDLANGLVGPNGAVNAGLPNVLFPLITPGIQSMTNATLTFTANDLKGVRAIVPKDGYLVEAAVWIGATSAGNVDVGVYDVTATTRTRLGSAGATAAGSTTAWQVLAFTAPIAVFHGQAIDIAVGLSNATCTIGNGTALTTAGMGALPAAAWNPTTTNQAGTTAGVTTGKLNWSIATSMPAPATLTEASLVATTAVPFVIVRMV